MIKQTVKIKRKTNLSSTQCASLSFFNVQQGTKVLMRSVDKKWRIATDERKITWKETIETCFSRLNNCKKESLPEYLVMWKNLVYFIQYFILTEICNNDNIKPKLHSCKSDVTMYICLIFTLEVIT